MICNTIGLTVDSFQSIYTTGGVEVEEVYGAINYGQPIYAKIREITGTSPLTFTSRTAGALTDYRISGETLQDGTPSPDYPVDVVGCGEKTENLYGGTDGERFGVFIPAGTTITASAEKLSVNLPQITFFRQDGTMITYSLLINTSENRYFSSYNLKEDCYYIGFDYAKKNSMTANVGSNTAYIPYGYKLPLTVNGTEYPIYLGQVETTRRIKKLVLTGDEGCSTYGGSFIVSVSSNAFRPYNVITVRCSHYLGVPNANAGSIARYDLSANFSITTTGLLITDRRYNLVIADFKSYLAAQYAAGNPVTVWYVLKEPETGIVNEPLHRIGEYADTISMAQAGVTIPTASGANVLDVTSAVKPSQMYIKGKIKPDGYGNLTDKNGVYILDKDGVQLTVHGQGTSNA